METENNILWSAEQDEDEIDLLELAGVLLKKSWLIMMVAVICAAATGLYTFFMVTPQYKATSMIYVYSKTTSITSLADLQIGSQLAVDFQIVATTREVLDNVIEKNALNTSYEQLLQTVEIENPKGSHILKISVRHPNPVMAAQISNSLADELRSRIADVMNTDAPSMVDRAVVPTKKDSPSLTKNTVLGALAGFVVAVGYLTIAYLMDDTIKTSDDVKKYLHLNVLAEIPLERTLAKKESG